MMVSLKANDLCCGRSGRWSVGQHTKTGVVGFAKILPRCLLIHYYLGALQTVSASAQIK